MGRSCWLLGTAAALLVPAAAQAQWQNGDLAVRTNGNLFQAGDRLRVELLALGPILGPFSAEVRYRFIEDVKVVGEGGIAHTRKQERVVTRPLSAVVERMETYQRVVLDDTFRLGEGRTEQCLRIDVGLFATATDRRPFTTLGSCVCQGRSREIPPDCAPYLRGLEQALTQETLFFDGTFSADGDYSLVLLFEDRVEIHVPRGTPTVASGNLEVFSPLVRAAAGRALDVLLHDHRRERSSTVSRLPLPAGIP